MAFLKRLAEMAKALNPKVDTTAVARTVDSAELRTGLTLLDGSLLQASSLDWRAAGARMAGARTPSAREGGRGNARLFQRDGARDAGACDVLPQAGVIHSSGYKLVGTDHLGNKYYQRDPGSTLVRGRRGAARLQNSLRLLRRIDVHGCVPKRCVR